MKWQDSGFLATTNSQLLRLLRRESRYAYDEATNIIRHAKFNASNPAEAVRSFRRYCFHHILTTINILTIVWVFTLYWGEVSIFNSSIDRCEWNTWESWPEQASPHHLIFVTDPQLVDPHTYPDRPWPLSTLTIKHTDLYLRRAYSRLQRNLDPDTILFLGDLFDGGREWSTGSTESPEEQYRKYGGSFWVREYDRFSNIFFHDWRDDVQKAWSDAPRIQAGLPGNHDLGFGARIQLPVRDRFQAFFGDSNRMDIIANHTFVSLDTVSLSAKDVDHPENWKEIWEPADNFLNGAQQQLSHLYKDHMTLTQHKPSPRELRRVHSVEEVNDHNGELVAKSAQENVLHTADFPIVLLTHVPMFRKSGTPCGSHRERWPPTPPPAGQIEPLDPDERNSLHLGAGYQYQNTISQLLTSSIIDRLGGAVEYAFSGDDHDYCEVIHKAFPNKGAGIKEITVKSISWAMGVRKPGFLMVSLWNEVDENGRRTAKGHERTMQTNLCLLPDQLSIFIRYLVLIVIVVVCLTFRTIAIIYYPSLSGYTSMDQDDNSILPSYSMSSSAEQEKLNGSLPRPHNSSPHPGASSSSSDDSTASASLSARNPAATRPRSTSPLSSYGYGLGTPAGRPLVSYATNREGWDSQHKKDDDMFRRGTSRQRGRQGNVRSTRSSSGLMLFVQEFIHSFWSVAWKVFIWYFWLLRK